jgi:hypothetical protein
MEQKPGSATSEFKLTAVVVLVGTVLDAIGISLEALRDNGIVTASWLSPVLVVVGSLLVLGKALGYTRSRTLLKLAEQQGAAAQAVKEIGPPLAQTLRELLSELKAAKAGLPSGSSTSATPPPS